MATHEQEQALAWIVKKWKNDGDPPCEMCGAKEWGVAESIKAKATLSQFPFEGEMPFVPIICQNCGNTKLLNAVLMRKGAEE